MAIIDKLTEFCDGVSFVAEAGTTLKGNQIDMSVAAPLPGSGQPVFLIIQVGTAATDGGDSATLTFKLASDDTASISTTTSTIHFQSPALLKAELTAGKRFVYMIPAGGPAYERYLGILATVATAGFDTGTFDAWLSFDNLTTWKSLPDNAH